MSNISYLRHNSELNIIIYYLCTIRGLYRNTRALHFFRIRIYSDVINSLWKAATTNPKVPYLQTFGNAYYYFWKLTKCYCCLPNISLKVFLLCFVISGISLSFSLNISFRNIIFLSNSFITNEYHEWWVESPCQSTLYNNSFSVYVNDALLKRCM